MDPHARAQELARRFNEDEAVWTCFERKRELRRLLGPRLPRPEAGLNRLDWLEAEHECLETRCIGRMIP